MYMISAPAFTWGAGLTYTNFELVRMQDVDMFKMFKKYIGEGVSSIIGDRSVESNENHKNFYVDQTNLYGWAMMQFLPYGNVKLATLISIKY